MNKKDEIAAGRIMGIRKIYPISIICVIIIFTYWFYLPVGRSANSWIPYFDEPLNKPQIIDGLIKLTKLSNNEDLTKEKIEVAFNIKLSNRNDGERYQRVYRYIVLYQSANSYSQIHPHFIYDLRIRQNDSAPWKFCITKNELLPEIEKNGWILRAPFFRAEEDNYDQKILYEKKTTYWQLDLVELESAC